MTRARNTAKRTDYRCGPTLPLHSDDEAMICRRTCGTETWHRRTTLPVITSDGARFLRTNFICRQCEGE